MLSNGNSQDILEICAVAEIRSKFDLFLKLCRDLCKNGEGGALAKRHGSAEEVGHVTSISELWRIVLFQIEVLFTDENKVR